MIEKPLKILLMTALSFLLVLPSVAREKDRARGRILLAGVVHAPYGQNDGGSELAEGVGGVPDAQVEIVGTDHRAPTDRNGFFYFTKAPKGEVVIQITKPGFKTVSKTVEVDSGSLEPTQVSVQMLPDGMASDGKHLSGSGVVYIAYSKDEQSSGGPGSTLPIFDFMNELFNGADPLGRDYSDLELLIEPKRKANPYNLAHNQLMVYPASTPSRTTFHKTVDEPYYLTFDAGGDNLYVADTSSAISILDANDRHKRIGIVPLARGSRVTSLSLSPNKKFVMATVMGAQTGVLVIDPAQQKAVAFLPLDDLGIAVPKSVTATSGAVLVTAGAKAMPGKLIAVDPYTGATIKEMKVGQMPRSASITPDGRWAYVANSESGNVSVVDLQKMETVGFIQVGVGPVDTAVTKDGKQLLVANQGSDTVSIIDTEAQKVSAVIEVGREPTMLALTADDKTCYVTNRRDHNVSTIDLETMQQVHVSDPMPHSKPTGIAIRP
jgi:YVTN family beta-propeller protein